MRRIGFILILLSLSMLLLAGCSAPPVLFETIDVHDNSALTETTLHLENEYLSFDFDCETTAFTLTDKASGTVWYSNPPEAAVDPIAVQNIKDRMQSQIVLTYGQMSGTTTEVNNYALSIAGGTYKWEATDESVKVTYTIGKVEKVYIVPPAMTESRTMEYYELMDREQQRLVDNYFRIINIDNLRATDNREELLAKYPELEEERIFELREGLQGHILERIETAFEEVGYTMEDFIADSHATEEQLSENPAFNVSMVYALDGPDFTVSVPLDEIEYRHAYPVLSMSVLPFFGASGMDDDGFMFVPDASGAIIYNNNDKHNQTSYSVNIYGFDAALKRDAILSENFAYMPLFGVSREQEAFICVIEEGDSSLAIEADVSGRISSYNAVGTRYTVVNWDDVDISKANVIAKAFDRSEMTGELKQRYIFLSEPGYVSMAQAYREYLMSRYPSLQAHNEQDLPIVLNLIGAINKTENIMGVPVERPYALTKYTQAADIIDSFADAGIDGMRVNYVGWFNGGVLHDAPGNIKLVSALGGKRGYNDLLGRAENAGAKLYFEADFTFIYNGSVFNGFGEYRDSARRLSREVARIYPYSFTWFGERTGNYGTRYSHHLANPEYTLSAIDGYYAGLRRLGGANITFNSIGRSLNSDFNYRKIASRRDVMHYQQEKLAEIMEDGSKILIHGGNVYAVPFADTVIDVSLESNNFNILDESIPFYQIVFHGLVPYTGSPVNLSPNYERSILNAVETGAGLQFMLMNAPGEDLLETNYARYYASDFSRWGDRPAELYNRLNSELSHTASQFITGHERLAGHVTLTQYEDGTQVIVNYSDKPFDFEGTEVPGMDFRVIRN